jgi:hypothetical protein
MAREAGRTTKLVETKLIVRRITVGSDEGFDTGRFLD